MALVTWQALRGRPLVRPDGLTIAALALIIAGWAGVSALALRGGGTPVHLPKGSDTRDETAV